MKKIIGIVGPTGVGKTKLSIELAKKLDGEVINCDSTQVYKGLAIATAKVTEEEMEKIPHHLLSFKELEEDYTVYDFQKDARTCIEDILKRGKTPILVGGTGLYLKAVLYDYQFEEQESTVRYNESNEELYERILRLDPQTKIHKNNRRRMERYLSYYDETGKKLNEKEKAKKIYDFCLIGLTTDRETLYERINTRVDKMLKQGLLKEAESLYKRNIRTKAVLTPIGYKELFAYFEGNCSLEESIAKIKQSSRHYAKRQYTWFHHQMDVTWFSVSFKNFEETVEEVYQYITKI